MAKIIAGILIGLFILLYSLGIEAGFVYVLMPLGFLVLSLDIFVPR